MLNSRMKLIALTVLLAVAVVGCGSPPPMKYYVLDAPGPTPNAAAPTSSVSVLVARVVTSHLYRDTRIVYGSGPVQLGVYDTEHWSQTPADMMQDMLVSTLRTTGQYRSVSRVGTAARGDFVVRSHLYALYEVDKPALVARFSMQVELFDPKTGTTLFVDNYTHDEPVNGKKVPDVVEAMSRNVHVGMQQFASGIGQYISSHPPQPPATGGH